jgi:hypothetical protein
MGNRFDYDAFQVLPLNRLIFLILALDRYQKVLPDGEVYH